MRDNANAAKYLDKPTGKSSRVTGPTNGHSHAPKLTSSDLIELLATGSLGKKEKTVPGLRERK